MELILENLKEIPTVNFGIDKIPSRKICKFLMICLELSGLPLFFFRIQKTPEDNFSFIFSYFLDEIVEKFSLEKNDIEKLICNKCGGYIWIEKKKGGTEVCISNEYGIEYDQVFTINLLSKNLGL